MKERIKMIIVFILGGITLGGIGVYAATIISSINVGYSNENSKLVADNVQAAIDEVYDKSFNKELTTAYEYSEQEPKCINGEEKTCVKTDCYKKGKTCKQGTVIKYYVNNHEFYYFYVLHDDGTTITMQQRENTVRNIPWHAGEQDNSKGPDTILPALEQATSTWTNVNILNYKLGETILYENQYTKCSMVNGKVVCNDNTYILGERKARARIITALEASNTGCLTYTQDNADGSCPEWMYNYLLDSKTYGGSYNDTTKNVNGEDNHCYWTSSALHSTYAMNICRFGSIHGAYVDINHHGARAVVEITKP